MPNTLSALSTAKLQTLVLTSRPSAADHFYRVVLGLTPRAGSDGALVFDVGGGDLRVSPVPATAPTEHTVFGFAVADVRAAVLDLRARGVEFEQFAGFHRDADGLLTTPDGAKVAWFRDPDGNLLSVVEYPEA